MKGKKVQFSDSSGELLTGEVLKHYRNEELLLVDVDGQEHTVSEYFVDLVS